MHEANDQSEDTIIFRDNDSSLKINVPGYSVKEMIGRGGMGVVVKARQTSLDRDVALKVINNDDDNHEMILRLEREAKTLAGLDHPNIVGCHDIVNIDSDTVLIMDFIPGGNTIGSLIKTHGAFPEHICKDIIHQIIRGLTHALNKGIIHRDIKPDNLLVRTESGVTINSPAEIFDHPETRIMIVDFGIARSIKRDGDGDITDAGHVVGTPNYMSPEQAIGKDVDFRSDMYALGACVYYMLSGKLPHPADTVPDIILKKIEEPVPNVRDENPDVSRHMSNVLQRMMATQPEDRYESYEACLHALDNPEPERSPRKKITLLSVIAVILVCLGFVQLKLASSGGSVMSPSHWHSNDKVWTWGVASDEDLDIAVLGTPGSPLVHKKRLNIPVRIDFKARQLKDGITSLIIKNDKQPICTLQLNRDMKSLTTSFIEDAKTSQEHTFQIESYDWVSISLRCHNDSILFFTNDTLSGNLILDESVDRVTLSFRCNSGESQVKNIEISALKAD